MKLRLRTFIITLAVLVMLPVALLAENPLPKGWQPHLDSVAELIGSELEQSTAQQEMNRLSGRLAEVREAELVIAYLQLYAVLPADERAKLKTQQTQWLKKRQRAVEEAAPNDSLRGTIAPLEENEAFSKITQARTEELKGRLKKLP